MKRAAYLIIVTQMIFTACSTDDSSKTSSFDAFLKDWDLQHIYQPICTFVTDAVVYPELWTMDIAETFVIPNEIIYTMSTCGLLKTWQDYPPRSIGPWMSHLSTLNFPGVSSFNNSLRSDLVTVELLEREDCVVVLMNEYLSVINKNKEPDGRQKSFEMLLASDMCMSILNEKEKIQLMAIAMENSEPTKETRHIMAAIMKTTAYMSFLKEVGSDWEEYTFGYKICSTNIVQKHAKRYLNEKRATL